MKRIIYILVALSAVWFAGCQEDQLEGEMPGKEVPLTFNGRSSNLSLDALTAEVDALHLLIFNEDCLWGNILSLICLILMKLKSGELEKGQPWIK